MSILIGAQVKILRIRTRDFFFKLRKKNFSELWKYDLNLTIQKALVRIWQQLLREEFHIIFKFFLLYYILRYNMEVGMKMIMNVSIFYHSSQLTYP